MMTGIDAITVHGYSFEEPVVPEPAPQSSPLLWLIAGAAAWLAWRSWRGGQSAVKEKENAYGNA